jgi:hypothetical protein
VAGGIVKNSDIGQESVSHLFIAIGAGFLLLVMLVMVRNYIVRNMCPEPVILWHSDRVP